MLGDVATEYVELQQQPLVPLKGKQPFCTGWASDHVHTDSCWSVADAFGIRLDGLTVVDLDHIKNVDAEMRQIITDLETLTVMTPRGLHVYLRGEVGGFSRRGLGDVMSGKGRQVVAPDMPDRRVIGHGMESVGSELGTALLDAMWRAGQTPGRPAAVYGPFETDNRNNSLYGLYKYLAGEGWGQDAARQVVRLVNENTPGVEPLTDEGCDSNAACHCQPKCELASTIFHTTHDSLFH